MHGCCKFIEKHKTSKCMHYMCANCIDSSKSCQICLQNNNECTYCNVSTKDLILLSCQHSICSLCKNTKRDCKKCKLGSCYQCKINKATCDGSCGHNLCHECYKNRPKCEKCFIQNKLYCPNCNEESKENKSFLCGHHGCIKCSINITCYKCAYKFQDKYVREKFKICSFCMNSSKEYQFLRCGDIVCFLCLESPKERIRVLNYSCLLCIKKGKVNNQICTYCHKETGWVTN